MKYEIVAINCITLTTGHVFWHKEGMKVGAVEFSVSDMFVFFYRAICFNMYDDVIIYICLFFCLFCK